MSAQDSKCDRTSVLVHVPKDVGASAAGASMSSTNVVSEPSDADVGVSGRSLEQPVQYGPYRVVRQLGAGGMGAVYSAVDSRDGRRVALKVLARDALPDAAAVRRFKKEARLLSEVRHPHVTNLLDVGDDRGICYLVMELVDGVDLKSLLSVTKQLPERAALQIAAQVAEALSGAHARGIVHRDIKPANILLTADDEMETADAAALAARIEAGATPFVKLTDFGLARHIQQSASLELTRTGAMLGTPYYIAPEQCSGAGELGPGSDVYSLGATLFEMLGGRPPFVSSDPVKLLTLHCFEQPPELRRLNSSVSDGTASIVARALAKQPGERYADAAHLLSELTERQSGEVRQIELHPQLPEADGHVAEVCWEWDLESPPEVLWPLASNTERINCAVGVPAVEYRTERDEHGALLKIGAFNLGWSTMEWEEHPFEWVEGRRLGVLREFRNGPFQWFVSVVELSGRPGGGTLLQHTVRIATRGMLGRLLAHLELNVKGKKAVDRVYRRMDAVASGRLRTATIADPFVAPSQLGRGAQQRFETRQTQLEASDVDLECADHLVRYLEHGPLQELARIRPRALARQLGMDGGRMLNTCLRASQAGLLELHWDILCPTCRVPSTVLETLKNIERHSYCEACDLDFELDFQNAVELVFRVHPELRRADLRTYCIGGPEHAPHVVAQVRLNAAETFEMDVALEPGTYVLRGPQLPYTIALEVRGGPETGRVTLSLGKSAPGASRIRLDARRQLLLLENQTGHPQVVRLERTIPRSDVVSAAQASEVPLFRELFPEEVSSRDQLSDLGTCTVLGIRVLNTGQLIGQSGRTAADGTLDDFRRRLRECIQSHGGMLIDEEPGRSLGKFSETIAAVRAAVAALDASLTEASATRPQAVLHQGAALSQAKNGRLDVYGKTVSDATASLNNDSAIPLMLARELDDDDEVRASLRGLGFVSATERSETSADGVRCYGVLSPTEPAD